MLYRTVGVTLGDTDRRREDRSTLFCIYSALLGNRTLKVYPPSELRLIFHQAAAASGIFHKLLGMAVDT